MEHEKIIDKIKKCLALSNSDNPHEAAAGLRQAQKLMQMHGLNELDIELSDVQEMRAKASNAGVVAWESLLANLVQGFANSDKTKQLIEHYMDSKYPNMETAKMRDRVKGRNITNNDYFNGNMEARNAQLHHGVGGKKSQGLLS